MKIENLLEDINFDYKVVLMENNDENPELPDDIFLPVLIDDNGILQGSEAIIGRIEELEIFKIWDKFQNDTCHCNKQVITHRNTRKKTTYGGMYAGK